MQNNQDDRMARHRT